MRSSSEASSSAASPRHRWSRAAVAIAVAALASPALAEWKTQVLTYRGIQSISMDATGGGTLVSFLCARDPRHRESPLPLRPPRVFLATEPSREFTAMPGDPGGITISLDGIEQSMPAELVDNDSKATAFSAGWPGLYRLIQKMLESEAISVTAWTEDGRIKVTADLPADGIDVAAREFIDACSP